MGCLRLTYEENESPLRVSRDEKEDAVNWQVWVNENPEKKVKGLEAQSNGGNTLIKVYSELQYQRILAAGDDIGEALRIAYYATENSFVDGNGNPSDYAERQFRKKHGPGVNFPANGRSGEIIFGTNADITIQGLNFQTGQFDDLHTINVMTPAERTDAALRKLFEHGIDEVVNRIFRLPPIIIPPGLLDPPGPGKPPKG